MDKATAQCAAVLLATMADVPDQPIIEGPAYAALMGKVDLATFQASIGALAGAGMIQADGPHVWRATPKGIERGRQLNALLARCA